MGVVPLGGLYRRDPIRSAIQSLVACDLASITLLVMCDRLVSRRYAGAPSGGKPNMASTIYVSKPLYI